MAALNNSSTLPLLIDNAFTGRGFMKLSTSLFIGSGTIGIGGTYTMVVPGATINNVVLATYTSNAGGILVAFIRESSVAGLCEIYVEGVATETFNYVVFFNTNYSQ